MKAQGDRWPQALGWLGMLSSLVAADVLVVDASGGGEHVQISAAVSAAAPWDTLLVRAGTYAGFVVDGKPLVICAEPGASVVVDQAGTDVRLQNLRAGQTVVLRGVVFHGGELAVRDNAGGQVRFEACTLRGRDGLPSGAWPPFSLPGAAGVEVVDSRSVAFLRCTLVGGNGYDAQNLWEEASSAGGPGLLAVGSKVALDHSEVTGGRGGYDFFGALMARAGEGACCTDCRLFLAGSSLTGGFASGRVDRATHPGAGDGLRLDGAGSRARLLDCDIRGGPSDDPACVGQGIRAPLGLIVQHPGATRALRITSPVREGQVAHLVMNGKPGDGVLLYVSAQAGWVEMPGRKGALLVRPPLWGPFALGPIGDPGGQLDLPVTIPSLPANLEAVNLHLQALFQRGDERILGPATVLTLLDSAY